MWKDSFLASCLEKSLLLKYATLLSLFNSLLIGLRNLLGK